MPHPMLVLLISTWVGTGLFLYLKGVLSRPKFTKTSTVIEDPDHTRTKYYMLVISGLTFAISGCDVYFIILDAPISLRKVDFSDSAILSHYTAAFVTIAALIVALLYIFLKSPAHRPVISYAKTEPNIMICEHCRRKSCQTLKSTGPPAETISGDDIPGNIRVVTDQEDLESLEPNLSSMSLMIWAILFHCSRSRSQTNIWTQEL